MTLKLEFPELKHKNSYEKLIIDWGKFEDIEKTSPGALFYGDDFEGFLKKVESYRETPPKGFVKSSLFLLTDGNEIVGAIDIRHNIDNPFIKEVGGHIGYGIAPKHRRKGYASKMLELGLIEAKKLNLDKLLITCDIDNIGSNKVIEKNGGVFERIAENGTTNRYLINLK